MIPIIGSLYRENNVTCYIYGRTLVNRSVISIMQAHIAASKQERMPLTEVQTIDVFTILKSLNLGHAHIDVGRLAAKYYRDNPGISLIDFVKQETGDSVHSPSKPLEQPQDVVLYGFGRIGRLMARLLIEKTAGGDTLRLKAVVVRKGGSAHDLQKRASLFERDSVHGRFNGTVRILEDEDAMIINGNKIQFIYSDSPATIDYTQYGIKSAIIVDNTGAWKTSDALSQHLQSKGAAKVLLTAPGNDIKNIVMGVNDHLVQDDDQIICAASCTTNAIVPTLKIMNDNFGIVNGHVETVHSYTNDQNLIDNYHKADRRGRSAAMNMVITSTGAAKAATKALPELSGKLTGNAIRVPTPNVSMAILNLTLEKSLDRHALNEFIREKCLHSDYIKQIAFSESPEMVSTDVVGSRTAAVFDAQATIVNNNSCVLYLWYDNEFGYTCQVRRVLEKMAGVKYTRYPRIS